MTYYQNTINEMVSIILEKKLPYDNTIIIGNNSSGKSELLTMPSIVAPRSLLLTV